MSLIEFDRISKSFAHTGGARMLRGHIEDRLRNRTRETFQALKHVSFRLDRGESLAIVGGNGAGKSTLLSLVAGLAEPTEGRLTVSGRVAALLELGSGFHPDLTGLENLQLNAALLGLSRKQTLEARDNIVEFSGIGEFIDQPLRTYSSGMIMRLAFSVAIHSDPDILIVDEVLAVGDQSFQVKCYEKITASKRAGKTLLFVSHSPQLVQKLCERALWLDHGEVVMDGAVGGVIQAYAARAAAAKV
jgi:ABC-type polysaccharide/polyol phosphate transport system ATPase subunit